MFKIFANKHGYLIYSEQITKSILAFVKPALLDLSITINNIMYAVKVWRND